MITYIMFLYITTTNTATSPVIKTIDFSGKDSCIEAGLSIVKNLRSDPSVNNVTYVCVKK
jgi:hypothetical protein